VYDFVPIPKLPWRFRTAIQSQLIAWKEGIEANIFFSVGNESIPRETFFHGNGYRSLRWICSSSIVFQRRKFIIIDEDNANIDALNVS
jgi:hypothetical protein